MPAGVAASIIVFGRGLEIDGTGFALSEASRSRVRALAAYLDVNAPLFSRQRARVVFSGGWGATAAKMKPPPAEFREGALMLKYAQTLPVHGGDFAAYADSSAEIESDSTLENVLRTKENGYFRGLSFTAADPLGIVTHADHCERVKYFIEKVFGLPGDAVLAIAARGTDQPSELISERLLLRLTRMAFTGATTPAALRRRQRLAGLVHAARPG